MRLTREQLTADVSLLEVRPGDLLVVEVDSDDDATLWVDGLGDYFREHGIKLPVLVAGPNVRLRVAREVDS